MARPRRHELLLTGVLHGRRPAGAQRHECREILDEHLLLHPEAATDPRLDHANAMDGDLEQSRDDTAYMERDLRRADEHQPAVVIEIAGDHVWLDRRVLGVMRLDGDVDGGGRGCQGRVDVSGDRFHVCRNVVLRVPCIGARLVVHQWGTAGTRLIDRQHGFEDLVVDLDEIDGGACLFHGVRCHGSDTVTNESHLGVEHAGVVR
jgi:hypothetical protein